MRFGNVIGSDGSALPYFYNQIKKNLPILLTDKKMQRYFMTIKEACGLVLQSTKINSKNKLLFLDMGKPVKIYQIIKKIFNIFREPNQQLKVKIIGNIYNEKISERLSIKKKYYKTKIKKIYSNFDNIQNTKKVEQFISTLEKNINVLNNNNMYKLIRNFIKIK